MVVHICTHCSFVNKDAQNILTKCGHQNQCDGCLRLATLVGVISPEWMDCMSCYGRAYKNMMIWDCGHWTCGCTKCPIHKSAELTGYVDCIQKPIDIPVKIKCHTRRLYIFMEIKHNTLTSLGRHNERIAMLESYYNACINGMSANHPLTKQHEKLEDENTAYWCSIYELHSTFK